jgi:hypothetical protein
MSQTKPFFIPQKEFDLINQMNEELIDELVGQSVDIYKVNIENTNENIYGESTTKYYDIGFRVNCLIEYAEPEIIQDEFGADLNGNISMFFQRENLASGSWNDYYWEINGTTEPQLFAGHPNFKHNIVATAHRSRLSSLQIEERPR